MLLYARSEGLRQMGKWVIALLATGVALVAASARAQTGQVLLGPTVYSSRNLPANAITRFTVGCPRGYFAVSGGVSSPGPGSTLLSVRPVGLRAYTFRFGNPVTKDSTRVTVLVACRTIRRGPVLIVKPVKTRLVVRPGQIKSGRSPVPRTPPRPAPRSTSTRAGPGRSTRSRASRSACGPRPRRCVPSSSGSRTWCLRQKLVQTKI